MRHRDIDTAIKKLDMAINEIDKMLVKYPKRFKDELSEIGRSVIDEWYDSYNRRMYEPYGSLYYAYKIEVKNGVGTVRFSPKFIQHIKHNQKSTFIFNNSFMEGYHGGSYDKGGTFSEPFWRTPPPKFPSWSEPAVFTFSPYDKMYDEMQKCVDKMQDDFNKDIQRIRSFLSPHVSRMKGGR